MSELIQKHDSRATIRWKLLTSASALALTVSVVGAAKADDADHPQIWIELGGQAESISGQGQPFDPGFLSVYPTSPVLQKVTPLQAQKPPLFSFSEDGKITFQPEDSDWVFSAAIRYGRSSNPRHVDHQTSRTHGAASGNNISAAENFADTHALRSEQHTVLDFLAGKDIGLGLFGGQGSSTLSFGVRFAQFTSKSDFDIRARPDLHVKYYAYGTDNLALKYFHTYNAKGYASRGFRGVGPTLSWNGSVPFAGNQQDGEITLDWGANAALLFGRQKARVRHQETARYDSWKYIVALEPYASVYHHPLRGHDTDRSITVPNVGASVGLSWRVQDFKASFGYRYDTFLSVMDTGIDTAKKSNLTFNGPYASISIGLGD